MTSEAQTKARDKWNRTNVKFVGIKFYPSHIDEYEHLMKQPLKSDYIRRLIRRDMEKEPSEE